MELTSATKHSTSKGSVKYSENTERKKKQKELQPLKRWQRSQRFDRLGCRSILLHY
ncbi:hypothetical protein NE237_008762 [Protea cynaroides]|uniref:Uncharacterized protein n=1 Tax=Protea cynaroides TaxID=273540 RepID=A0A9Q0QZZ9_9MAGN|nr:hypothetical protein NE237_008762 [Protea cynaroides]